MKKYTVINNETGHKNHYSSFMWNLAWLLAYIIGFGFGILYSNYL